MRFKYLVGAILVAVLVGTGIGVSADASIEQTSVNDQSMIAEEIIPNDRDAFDVSALEVWCGEPCGEIRMIGASYYAEDAVIDETGNVWNYDGDLDEEGFYLLWLDDMGTDEVEDDEIIKLWVEVY